MTTKLTVEVDDDLAKRVAVAAVERGVAPEALAAEILAERFPARRKLSFVSLGRSTSGRRASEDEEMLAEGFGR
jgi:predicted transcriptional regulator